MKQIDVFMSKFLIILFLVFFLNTGSGEAFFNKKEFKFERCYTEAYSDHDIWVKEGLFYIGSGR